MNDKCNVFKEELDFIKNDNIRMFVEKNISELPDYFFKVPASSSGKYHPSYALGDGGLARHVRACVRIAVELFTLEMFSYFSDDEKDLIIVSLLLHDGYKHGKDYSKYTVANHPIVMSSIILDNQDLQEGLTKEQVKVVADNISHHMGQWVSDYKTNQKILEKPSGKMQNFVHLVDYLASRKCLEFNFEVKIGR